MSTIELTGDYEFTVERSDGESGDIIVTLEVGGDTVKFSAGRFASDADDLAGALRRLTADAEAIVSGWEDRPDESDGYVTFDRGGYYATLEGEQAGGRRGFPSRDIATYELARMMADSGYFPNAWYQDERGGYEYIGEAVRAFHDEGGDKLKPLPGARYQEGDEVLIGSYDYPYVVDHDYGDLGVMLHISGDPSITEFEQHDNLRPYDDE